MLKKNKPLRILVPKMSAYRKDFDVSFLIKDGKLLEKYIAIGKYV